MVQLGAIQNPKLLQSLGLFGAVSSTGSDALNSSSGGPKAITFANEDQWTLVLLLMSGISASVAKQKSETIRELKMDDFKVRTAIDLQLPEYENSTSFLSSLF